jgi:hypothetical protein
VELAELKQRASVPVDLRQIGIRAQMDQPNEGQEMKAYLVGDQHRNGIDRTQAARIRTAIGNSLFDCRLYRQGARAARINLGDLLFQSGRA